MPKAKVTPPFKVESRSILWNIPTPAGIGALIAAVAAIFPARNVPFLDQVLERLPNTEARRAVLALLGFLLGYTSGKGADWLRIRTVRSLLGYQGWVTDPKSTKTKIWGLLLSALRGPHPFSTFQFQRLLPKQPLPSLNQTLDLWLQVARNLLSEDEWETTKELVEEFRQNEGPKLQQHLLKKAAEKDSWIHEYWMLGAYLSSRTPLPINSNYYIGHRSDNLDVNWLARGANSLYWMVRMEHLLSKEKFPPVMIQDMVPLCMHGFSHVFNSNRLPGEYMDEMVRYPGNGHIIIISKGHYFEMDMYHDSKDGGARNQLTPYEIKQQLQFILDKTKGMKPIPPVAVLTSQNRTTWFKHRKELERNNASLLRAIDTCMFVANIDEKTPKDYAEHGKWLMTGDGSNRWFDKCITYAVNGGAWCGLNVEHSGLDAMVVTNTQEYICVNEQYENNDVIKTQSSRPVTPPKLLEWDLRDMEQHIENAAIEYKKVSDDIVVTVLQPSFGKRYMKQIRMSPDGFIQMAMQLAYFRQHKFIPKTYEPSTGRLYLLGRTETVHPASQHSNHWVKVMDDENVGSKEKIELLRKALKAQSAYRLQATIGQGCDRHLVGMLCASRELGMDMPKLFTEKAWQMPFLLSTSQTPNMMAEYGCHVTLECCCGGFGPSHQDGYGICYAIIGEDLLNVHISSWQSSSVSDGARFAEQINQALEDMKKLCSA